MVDGPPTDNKDFVLALKHLQDREKWVRTVVKGQGSVGNDHTIGPSYADHCKALPIRPYDPDKAKFHLEKSGINQAVVHTAEVSLGAVDLCLVLQAEAAAASGRSSSGSTRSALSSSPRRHGGGRNPPPS